MVESTSIVEVVLADLPTPMLPKINREPTKKPLINFYRLISVNMDYVVFKLGRGQHGHLSLTITFQ